MNSGSIHYILRNVNAKAMLDKTIILEYNTLFFVTQPQTGAKGR